MEALEYHKIYILNMRRLVSQINKFIIGAEFH